MKWYFVCTGNICRSALGHAYLTQEFKVLNSEAKVASGGTGINQALVPTAEIKIIGSRYGLESLLENHRPQTVNADVLASQNIILCATTGHRAQVLAIAPALLHRVFTLKEFALLLTKIELPAHIHGQTSEDWWNNVLERIAYVRSLAFNPKYDLNIVDPFRAPLAVYEQAGEEIIACCSTIVQAEKYRLSSIHE